MNDGASVDLRPPIALFPYGKHKPGRGCLGACTGRRSFAPRPPPDPDTRERVTWCRACAYDVPEREAIPGQCPKCKTVGAWETYGRLTIDDHLSEWVRLTGGDGCGTGSSRDGR